MSNQSTVPAWSNQNSGSENKSPIYVEAALRLRGARKLADSNLPLEHVFPELERCLAHEPLTRSRDVLLVGRYIVRTFVTFSVLHLRMQ